MRGISAVADPGFGRGGPTLKREGFTPDFIELCQAAQNVCSNFGAGGPRPLGPPGSATDLCNRTEINGRD